jgi:Zn finger protein HypA/HybF involved in hydrogenase expression
MHESGIVASLVARAEAIVDEACAEPRRIGITVGALSGVEPDAVQTHWQRFAGPLLSGATLDIQVDDDPAAPASLGVVLSYVDIADGMGD